MANGGNRSNESRDMPREYQEESALRQQPHNIDAERAVLGTVLIDNTTLPVVRQFVTDISFYDPGHRAIFAAMAALDNANHSIDPTTLCDALKNSGHLDVVGGPAYVAQLEGAVLSTTNISRHCEIVAEKAARRQLFQALNQAAELIYDDSKKNSELATEVDDLLFEALKSARPQNTAIHIRDLTLQRLEELDKMRQRGESAIALTTHWPTFNTKVLVRREDMIIVAARTSVGKTAFALNLIDFLALYQRRPILFFSLEMTRRAIWDRLAASRSGVAMAQLDDPSTIPPEAYSRLQTEHARIIGSGELLIDDRSGLDISEIRAKAREIRTRTDLAAIFVDYLQLATDESVTKRRESRQQEVASISSGLKAIARDLRVPVIALCQLNRDVEKRRGKNAVPVLTDLRESGSIEQDADIVVMLHRPEFYNSPEGRAVEDATLFIRKQRNGALGHIDMIFKKKETRFLELEKGPPKGTETVETWESRLESGDIEETEFVKSSDDELPF